MNPRITVYIASKNYGRFVEEAIESVLRQTVNDWELILIDDGSKDHTFDVMMNYDGHPQIRCLRTEGIGLPAVNNLALKHANGKYIIRLDGDDIFDENILLVLANSLDCDDNLALVFPDYYLIDDAGTVFAHERRPKLYRDDHMMDAPPNGACTMIRTDILRNLGGYRQDLGAQDGLDLWLKLKDKHKATNVNLPLFFYRRHGANLTESPMRIIDARRELKKSTTVEKIRQIHPITAVIPCRRNYDFLPDLWNEKIESKSLLEIDIETCLASKLIESVVVACDNPAAEAVVNSFRDDRVKFVLRAEKSTRRSSNVVDTLVDVARVCDPNMLGVIVLRYVQTPFVATGTVEEAITSLLLCDADSACAVEKIENRILRRTPHGLVSINADRSALIGVESLYRDASTCIAFRTKNLATGSLSGAKAAGFEVNSAESFFITSPHDLDVARVLKSHRRVGFTNSSTQELSRT